MAKDGTGRAPGYWDAFEKNAKLPVTDPNKIGNRGQYTTVTAPASPAGGRTSGMASTKVTPEQKRAARNLLSISKSNASSTRAQLKRGLSNYDMSDRQNTALAQIDFTKNAGQSDADRFAQAQKLQSSARGLFAESGNAMQSSQLGEVGNMLNRRNRQDQTEAVTTLGANQQAVQRTLDESINANILARRDLINNAAHALRGLESDYSAQLNNINPKLFKKPGKGKANFGSKRVADRFGKIKANTPTRVGYYTSDAAVRGGY